MSLTPSTPMTEQLPLYKDYLHASRQEERRASDPVQKATFQYNLSDSVNSFLPNNISWEYNSNELEFE